MQEVYKKGQMHHHNLQGKECLSKLCEGFYSTGFSFLKIIFDTVEGLTAILSSPVTICVNGRLCTSFCLITNLLKLQTPLRLTILVFKPFHRLGDLPKSLL